MFGLRTAWQKKFGSLLLWRKARFYSRRYGQPHQSTHPHLLRHGEVTVGITASEYARRRRELVQALPSGSLVIFPAAAHRIMTNDIPYVYRQNTDFFYLCGFQEPKSLIALENRNGECFFSMFVQESSPQSETWDGPLTGVERAKEAFGADKVYKIEDAPRVLSDMINKAPKVYFNSIETDKVSNISNLLNNYSKLEPINQIIEFQRLIKSPQEIEMMRKSTSITARGICEVMKSTLNHKTEHTLYSQLTYEFLKLGSTMLAYPPVVASGASNLILHYIKNDSQLNPGDLILIDAGGEYYNYTSDLTRTWPFARRFSPSQLDVYNLVLEVQKKCIEHCIPGRMSLSSLHNLSVFHLSRGLEKLGLDATKISTFYPHGVGHYLGMDIHDNRSVQSNLTFKPGMIITVEPGLYLPDADFVPERFRGIGVRIEDDVLITEHGPEVLTREAPKDPHEIEALIAVEKIL